MWVLNQDGFFSVVQKSWDRNTDNVEVRSRNTLDLERFLKSMNLKNEIIKSQADYPFRIVTTRQIWGKYLAKMAKTINYDNFKHQIEIQDGSERAEIYLRVWSDLLKLEKIKQ